MIPLYAKLEILPLNDLIYQQKSIFMHNLHYGNLPFTLSGYCYQPNHSQGTRYTANTNYFLPYARTNRGQTSIRFAGPKVWATVPTDLKEIAFKKPFSRKMKEHLVSILKTKSENMPKNTHQIINRGNFCELQAIFDTSYDDDYEFFGFLDPNMEALFDSDDETEDFLGFSNFDLLEALFSSNDENHEFLGFGTPLTLESLFNCDSDNEEDFFGF